ncbi:PREDICTED: telomere repeat-binding protein 2 isoform X2 [Camelina sativa]|uniref:Telomere repeat-binding protein 2 isoform X2 n=1 Tax=Camelina sativa TaxID=90675 RepID=A0ABM1QDD8_CAMSA|nr:PREDICTED: telomere repeat-binding protein 2 isoform X2 [Camelina sativa]
MVSHKVLEFGDDGYKLPAQARAPRSLRKRRIYEKKLCAIDLLATVAGTLLLEGESSVNAGGENCLVVQNTVKKELQAEENVLSGSPSPFDNGKCGFSSVITTNPNHLLVVGDKLDKEVVEGFSNLGCAGSDSCKVRNFSKDLNHPGVNVKPDVVASIGSNSSTEVRACGSGSPNDSRDDDDVHLFSRNNDNDDDDENFSGYIRPRLTRPVPRIGDRRIRKILASRHWKGGNTDAKPWYCSKRSYYLHNHQRSYPIKKRKYFDTISDSNSDDYRLQGKTHKGNRTISSMKSRNASFVSRDHHVRLRIKSFRVPELFIEIPETATVGSLKRMVMEAVTTILGDGLRVGLMVQGKKVRDDSKTLLQTGISEENTHLDSLGFSLEPSLGTTSQPLLSSYLSENACDDLMLCRDNVLVDPNHDSTPSPSDSFGKLGSTDDSRALVPIASSALLAPRTPNRKFKRTEQQQAAHRRIRRPFSVTEVEALVQAVENLGTGRWRDVKVHAFVDAEHRTYVDLKDKWKTLVHTARISPQQRRGEPVPQELLDRVLKAHAYWSQHLMHQLQIEPPPSSQVEALI